MNPYIKYIYEIQRTILYIGAHEEKWTTLIEQSSRILSLSLLTDLFIHLCRKSTPSKILCSFQKQRISDIYKLRVQTFVSQAALLDLTPRSNDSFRCVDMGIQQDFTVRVRKGGFYCRNTLILEFGFQCSIWNLIYMYIYIYIIQNFNSRVEETKGDMTRGGCGRAPWYTMSGAAAGLALETLGPNISARGPKAPEAC